MPTRRPDKRSLVGKVCTITSGVVDGRFGTASCENGGAGLLLSVLCPKANTLKRGDAAFIIDYDSAKEAYEVEPMDWLLPEEAEALRDPGSRRH